MKKWDKEEEIAQSYQKVMLAIKKWDKMGK